MSLFPTFAPSLEAPGGRILEDFQFTPPVNKGWILEGAVKRGVKGINRRSLKLPVNKQIAGNKGGRGGGGGIY